MSEKHFNEDGLLAALSRAIFMRESHQAAQAYESMITARPEFCLSGPMQYDLARLLELGNEPRLALHAYEQLITKIPDHAAYNPSLRGAGHLAFRLKQHKKCRMYLEKFLKTDPITPEKRDAEDILARLPDGRGIPDNISQADSSENVDAIPMEQRKTEPESFARPRHMKLTEEEKEASGGLFGHPQQEAPKRASAPPPAAKAGADKDFFSAGSGEATTRAPVDGKRPSSGEVQLESYDPYSETPPLSISSRDIRPLARRGTSSTAKINAPGSNPKSAPPEPAPVKPVPLQLKPAGPSQPRSSAEVARPAMATPMDESEFVLKDRGPESREQRYYRLRDSQFAMLLPVKSKIHLENVAEILKATEQISDVEAKKAVLDRKGLLRDHLSLEEVFDIWPKMKQWGNEVVFVAIERALRPYERFDVMGMEVLDPGLKLTTEKGIKKARWQDIRLISVGRLDRKPSIDIFSNLPTKHYRLFKGIFNYHTVIQEAQDSIEAALKVLRILKEKAPATILSHTVDGFVSGRSPKPQKFASDQEYDWYNTWLLFAHCAEIVNVSDLWDTARATSNW